MILIIRRLKTEVGTFNNFVNILGAEKSFINNLYFFGYTFCVQLYTLSSHFCDNFFVRRQFYQTLLKLSGAFNLQLL